jgi:hypothetical protein
MPTRLKELETENSRLRRAISDLTLDKLILQEAARGNFQAPRVAAPVLSRSERICMSPSAAPVRRSGSTARHSAKHRGAVPTTSGSPPTSSSLAGNTAATAIVRSPGCWSRRLDRQRQAGRTIWRREGLKVPHKQPKRGRLWLADGSCIRLRADRYLRGLFTIGALAVIRYAKIHGTGHRPWLTALLARRPAKVAAIALANKIARMAWAMMARGEVYRGAEVGLYCLLSGNIQLSYIETDHARASNNLLRSEPT